MLEPLIIEWDTVQGLLDEGLAALVAEHWKEVGVHKDAVPLDVDWEGYQLDEENGLLKIIAARRGDRLIGYASYYVLPHRHYRSTLHALNDAIFVLPGERGAGIALIRAAERLLAAAARPYCSRIRIIYHAKRHVEADRGGFARVFERLGYDCFETSHDKVVMTSEG
jgi:GNAT superfamily N-acetyltransferase